MCGNAWLGSSWLTRNRSMQYVMEINVRTIEILKFGCEIMPISPLNFLYYLNPILSSMTPPLPLPAPFLYLHSALATRTTCRQSVLSHLCQPLLTLPGCLLYHPHPPDHWAHCGVHVAHTGGIRCVLFDATTAAPATELLQHVIYSFPNSSSWGLSTGYECSSDVQCSASVEGCVSDLGVESSRSRYWVWLNLVRPCKGKPTTVFLAYCCWLLNIEIAWALSTPRDDHTHPSSIVLLGVKDHKHNTLKSGNILDHKIVQFIKNSII